MVSLVLGVHLVCAFGATAVFWVPLAAAKGGPLHIAAGRLYARLIYATAATGAPLAVLLGVTASEPGAARTAAFLAYLITILVQPVHHGIAVVRARRGAFAPTSFHAVAAWTVMLAGLAMGGAALAWREWGFLLVSPIGPVMGWRALRYARNASRLNFPGSANRENSTGKHFWREEHIVAMVVSGMAVHTAMLVFGLTRTLQITMEGAAALVPWLLPALVGLPWLVWRVRRERRAFS